MPRTTTAAALAAFALALASCAPPTPPPTAEAKDPDAAASQPVDRFSDAFAHLFKRSGPAFDPTHVQPVLPAADVSIDFDTFFTVKARGPNGEHVAYYALDILPEVPARGFVFVDASGAPLANQLRVLETTVGDAAYNDFVRITEVKVADGYVENSLTSVTAVQAAADAGDVTLTQTTRIENWSMVPKGSIATRTFLGARVDGERAWIGDKVASLLVFDRTLVATADGMVPTSDIVVIFADDMSPTMGFAAEADGQTHNGLETLPGDPGYSSLWAHARGGLAGFAGVTDFASASANIAGDLPISVNCPVVD